MDPKTLIPYAEAIPAPWWALEGLGVGMLMLHLMVINVAVGGALIMLFTRMRRTLKPDSEWVPDALKSKLPTAFAIGINLGIAPLLFFQVIYGHIFYSASVLMAVYWLLVIPLLIMGYYGAHFHARKYGNRAVSLAWLSVTALVVLYIPFAFQNNISLQLHPDVWGGYFDKRGGTLLNLGDPVILPRYLHFITASIAVAGLFSAVVWGLRGRRGAVETEPKIARGLRIFGIATMVQVVIGFWLLLALPKEIMLSFMGRNMTHTVMLMLGLVFGLAVIMAAVLNKLRLTVGLFLATMLTMVLMRTFLRYLYLEPWFEVESLEVVPMYDVFVLFLIFLLVGLALVGMMLGWAVKSDTSPRTAGGEGAI